MVAVEPREKEGLSSTDLPDESGSPKRPNGVRDIRFDTCSRSVCLLREGVHYVVSGAAFGEEKNNPRTGEVKLPVASAPRVEKDCARFCLRELHMS